MACSLFSWLQCCVCLGGSGIVVLFSLQCEQLFCNEHTVMVLSVGACFSCGCAPVII